MIHKCTIGYNYIYKLHVSPLGRYSLIPRPRSFVQQRIRWVGYIAYVRSGSEFVSATFRLVSDFQAQRAPGKGLVCSQTWLYLKTKYDKICMMQHCQSMSAFRFKTFCCFGGKLLNMAAILINTFVQ